MKFTCSVDINQQIDKVIEIFSDQTSLKYAQEGFKSKVLNSGVSGEISSKFKLLYEKIEHIDTIIRNNLPKAFKGQYKHKRMVN